MKRRIPLFLAILGLTACEKTPPQPAAQEETAHGDAARGKAAAVRYQCAACHEIPGIEGPRGGTGPSLAQFAVRPKIAATVPNSQENLTQWIISPRSLKANTMMPSLNVSPQDAADIACFLGSLR